MGLRKTYKAELSAMRALALLFNNFMNLLLNKKSWLCRGKVDK